MTEKQTIIHLYRVDNYSIRKIAQATGRSRNTVRRIIREYLCAMDSPTPGAALDEYLAKKPSYSKGSGRRPWVMTPELSAAIDSLVSVNERRRAAGMKKQSMLYRDMYEHLLASGFSLSYSTLTRYLRARAYKQQPRPHEAFIRQSYEPGMNCEFDWGEVKLYLDGKLTKFYMAVFTMCHSNHRLAYLYRHQDTLAFMESHRDYFRSVNGVPMVMIYDNMRTAVKAFTGSEKLPTDALSRMSAYYRYSFRFCNARKGNEKGYVERSVEIVRRKAFSFNVRFGTIGEAQTHLTGVCRRLNGQDADPPAEGRSRAVAEDLAALQPLEGDIGCFSINSYQVDKWSTVFINKCHYSVPDRLVGKRVDVKLFSEKIEIYDGGKMVATHQRFYTNGEWSVLLEHYLGTFMRKPGSVAGSEALRQVPAGIRKLFASQFSKCPKDFVSLLDYARNGGYGYDDILRAYGTLRSRGMKKVSGDQVKAMLGSSPDGSIRVPHTVRDSQEHGILKGTETLLDSITTVMGAPIRSGNSN